MKKYVVLALLAVGLLNSCVEHEVIPSPKAKVNTSASFQAVINFTDIELFKNINGYECVAGKIELLAPYPLPSAAIYTSEMKSNSSSTAVKIKLGSIIWDNTVSAEPSLPMFESFMTNNTTPPFKVNGFDGFDFSYTDSYGVVWTIKSDDVNQSTQIENISTGSDSSGDYALFTVKFSTPVYHLFLAGSYDPYTGTVIPADIERSIMVQNAVFKTFFKK